MRDSNAELVRLSRSGDRAAIRTIHDRYCGRLYDHGSAVLRDSDAAASVLIDTFMLAFVELHRLRDQAKLEPWLFALARVQLLSRPRSQLHPPEPDNRFAPLLTRARALAWEAISWFPRRDRILLDLHVRQRLERGDLADAIGASPPHALSRASRLEARTNRLVGAILVAHLARDCSELVHVPVHAYDPRVTMRRYTHHVDRCRACSTARLELPSATELVASIPADPEPPELRGEALERVHLVLRELEVSTAELSDEPFGDPVLAPVPTGPTPLDDPVGASGFEPSEYDAPLEEQIDDDLGYGGYDLILELTPPPVPLERDGFPGPLFPERARLVAAAAAFVMAIVALAVVFDFRGVGSGSPRLFAEVAPPRSAPSTPPTTVPATTVPAPTTAGDLVAPTVSNLNTTYACIDPTQPTTDALATVTDDRALESVDLIVEHEVLGATRKQMFLQGGQYRASIGPYSSAGRITWRVEASDAAGHLTTREGPLVAAELETCSAGP